MKRLWIGLIILALLLAGCLAISTAMTNIHSPMAADWDLAAQKALLGDWPTALSLMQRANGRWHKYHNFIAAFADHTPMDEIDTLLEELGVYALSRENPHFSATCTHLSFMAEAMSENHLLRWWNLL